ncbi:MAG: sterol desaturase family protein [Chitinophagaceae bacterium]
MFQIPDISQPHNLVMAFFLFFAVIIGRYLLIAGLFYSAFYIWFPKKWQTRKLVNRAYKPGQLRKEVGWSTVTAIIFALAGIVTIWLWQSGNTRVYTTTALYGWWYVPVSLLLSMLLHESYYYWLHRLMHHPSIFRLVHKVHHDSNIPSPFTAFSFHPLEGLLQAIVLPLTLIVLPLHPYVILIQLTLMTFSSVINHLNIEIYPVNFHKHAVGKWIIGATHHSLHHKQYKYNFGLYFTFWDKFTSTESPVYDKLFETTTQIRKDI